MQEYLGYKITHGLRSIIIYHFSKKGHDLIMTSKRTPNKGVSMKDRKKSFGEFLAEYKIPIPEKLK